MFETRRIGAGPLFQLPPVSAHPDLPRARRRRVARLEACISWRVVGIADDILPQLIEAVQCMAECDVLRLFGLGILDVAEERALEMDVISGQRDILLPEDEPGMRT